jgi:hypothetical protein
MATPPLQACMWGLLAGVLAACALTGPSDQADGRPLPLRIGPLVHAYPDTVASDVLQCQPIATIATVRSLEDTLASRRGR